MIKDYIEYGNYKIYFRTSYFYKLRFFKKNMLPVSICIWDPKWYKGMSYKSLAPSKYDAETDCEQCIKEHSDDPGYYNLDCNYLKNYRKQLSYYNIERTLNDIIIKADKFYNFDEKNINNEIYIIFMGYEVSSKKCSERFELSRWIEQEYFISEISDL